MTPSCKLYSVNNYFPIHAKIFCFFFELGINKSDIPEKYVNFKGTDVLNKLHQLRKKSITF